MAWAREKRLKDGRKVYQATHRDPSGRVRVVGTYASKKAALAAARDAERDVETGQWFDRRTGRMTFRQYVDQYWWPNLHVEATTRAAYRSYLDKYFLPTFGDVPDVPDPAVHGAEVGGRGPRRRALASVGQ